MVEIHKIIFQLIGRNSLKMVSLLPTSVQEFRKVLTIEQKPLGGINTLVKDLKNGLRVQVRIAQKDFLEMCLKKGLYPKDVTYIAKRISKSDERRFKIESKRILKDRIVIKKYVYNPNV